MGVEDEEVVEGQGWLRTKSAVCRGGQVSIKCSSTCVMRRTNGAADGRVCGLQAMLRQGVWVVNDVLRLTYMKA